MKIALLNVTTTTQMGGVETFVWEIASRLPAQGVQVDVLGGRGPIRQGMPAGVRVMTFPYVPRALLSRIPLLRRSRNVIKLIERLTFAVTVLPTLLRERYDVLHIQKPYDLPLAWLARRLIGSKILFGCHGTDYFAGDTWFARRVDGAVSCSRFNASQIREHYHLSPVVIFNGFDPALFHPLPVDSDRRARFAGPGDYLLLYSGRLIRWKGIQHVLDALAALPSSVKLILTGEGAERAPLEEQAKRLGIADRVFFLGRVEQKELPILYSLCDLVVLPSLTHETFSIVACEALACERPVVGTRVGGIPELVEELVPPGKSAALAARIAELLADSERRAAIARRGREHVCAFLTWDATTERVVAAYRALMNGDKVFEH